jgi:hypothetical protein
VRGLPAADARRRSLIASCHSLAPIRGVCPGALGTVFRARVRLDRRATSMSLLILMGVARSPQTALRKF